MEIGQLKIYGIEVQTILHINIKAEVNRHARLMLECLISYDKVQEYLQIAQEQKIITLKADDTTLFCGYITEATCSVKKDYAQMRLTAMSVTIQLDKEKKTRTFQNTGKTYLDIVETMTPCMMYGENTEIGKIAVQYNETDWEFIKRLAARCNTCVYADMIMRSIYVQWGIDEKSDANKMHVLEAAVRKDYDTYLEKKENGLPELIEEDAVIYEIESDEFHQIGECIDYNGKRLYISEMECDMEHASFEARYTARHAAAMKVTESSLYELAGASLEGTVIDVSGDKVKVHIKADVQQTKEDAYWFPFSAMQSSSDGSGWYYMPEIGDCVKVCFPEWEESGAFAVSAVSTYNAQGDTEDKMADTNVKYMRNPSGKQLQLTPGQIQADGGAGATLLTMKTDGSISMESNNTLEFIADQTIEVYAQKKIEMQASSTLDIKADTTGEILMDETGEIRQLGGQVNINSEA